MVPVPVTDSPDIRLNILLIEVSGILSNIRPSNQVSGQPDIRCIPHHNLGY
jgi:hypothetical protein